VPAHTESTLEQRIVEAAAVLPAYGGVTGWAALRWMGAVWFDGLAAGGRTERPVVLVTADRSIRPQAGFDVSEERLNPRQLTVYAGLRVTTPVRSLFFEMRYAKRPTDAVIAADMAAYSDLVSRDEAAAFALDNPGWTGIGQMRGGVGDMSENAWSPAEVRMRGVWCVEAGLPRPLCNRPVFDLAGRLVGIPDLLDPVAGVAGEYEGGLHLAGAQRAHDVRREGRFRAVGLDPVTMLAGDAENPWPFVARLREAYARAARIPAADRAWTIALPPWWVPTFTVAQRRALTQEQRERYLRLRLRVG
jgi:hypothetical protein